MFPFVPTCENPMSAYTYFALWALIGGVGIGASAIGWWIRREIRRVEERVDHHDEFCDDTKDTLTEIQINLSGIKENVVSVNSSLGELAKSNRDFIKYLLEKGK